MQPDFFYLRSLIKSAFETFVERSIYIPASENDGVPGGSLYYHYSNLRREMIACGLLQPHGLETVASAEVVEISRDEYNTHELLKTSVEPWENIELNWAKTVNIRSECLLKADNIESYVNSYPCLKDARSQFLLVKDGEAKMKKKYQWDDTETLELFVTNVVPILKDNFRYIPKKYAKYYEKLTDVSCPLNLKTLFATSLFAFCLKPSAKKCFKGIEKTDAFDEPREKSFLNFFPIFETTDDAQQFIKIKEKLQYPCAHVVYDAENEKAIIMAQVGKIMWCYDSVSVKVAICAFLKIHFALETEYNPGAATFFWIMEKLCFNLNIEAHESKYGTARVKDIVRQLQADPQASTSNSNKRPRNTI